MDSPADPESCESVLAAANQMRVGPASPFFLFGLPSADDEDQAHHGADRNTMRKWTRGESSQMTGDELRREIVKLKRRIERAAPRNMRMADEIDDLQQLLLDENKKAAEMELNLS
jgi:hypothetical protein